jgi:dihydrofolate reductase
MGRLIYAMNVSLDGFVETPDGSLDWTDMDAEIHAWWNEQCRDGSAFVYGRRVYELMAAYWPTAEADPNASPVELDFARIWNAKPKIVFSNTLPAVGWNSRLTRGDVAAELTRMRAEFDGELLLGGATLAAEFIRLGLVDEYRLVVHPVVLGAGRPFFPGLEAPIGLRLRETHNFASGAVYLGYEAR